MLLVLGLGLEGGLGLGFGGELGSGWRRLAERGIDGFGFGAVAVVVPRAVVVVVVLVVVVAIVLCVGSLGFVGTVGGVLTTRRMLVLGHASHCPRQRFGKRFDMAVVGARWLHLSVDGRGQSQSWVCFCPRW